MKNLMKINLVKQPKNSRKCGAACIKMITDFYEIEGFTINEIWECITDLSHNGTAYCKTYKMGKYLNEKSLTSIIVKFKDLRQCLLKAKDNSVPVIMNHHSFKNTDFGHFTVFININGDVITLRDPEDEIVSIGYKGLESSFKSKSSNDEVSGNILIFVGNDKTCSTENCTDCGSPINTGIMDKLGLKNKDYLEGYFCSNCDKLIRI